VLVRFQSSAPLKNKGLRIKRGPFFLGRSWRLRNGQGHFRGNPPAGLEKKGEEAWQKAVLAVK